MTPRRRPQDPGLPPGRGGLPPADRPRDAAGSAFLAAEFRDLRDDLYALRDAPRCEAPPQGAAECRWQQEFAVSGVALDDGEDIVAEFTTPQHGNRWDAEFRTRGPLLEKLREGERVPGVLLVSASVRRLARPEGTGRVVAWTFGLLAAGLGAAIAAAAADGTGLELDTSALGASAAVYASLTAVMLAGTAAARRARRGRAE
ncbi:hypothetical protein [Actinomadura sp. WAC 06369]|uniref:hypothetical protein n=1 Tax=Actinomadura sp. WAC 06369 TaxID=2203193 RepID=UPI000F7B8697|nr:hypothetical protein [Actinomadura sp. WAC 06369]RSN52512.1 hypothetical protein DMH08_28500 [Actinomadura sp. WAC 06369]